MKKLSIASVLLLGAGMARSTSRRIWRRRWRCWRLWCRCRSRNSRYRSDGRRSRPEHWNRRLRFSWNRRERGVNGFSGLANRNSRNRCQRRFYGLPNRNDGNHRNYGHDGDHP